MENEEIKNNSVQPEPTVEQQVNMVGPQPTVEPQVNVVNPEPAVEQPTINNDVINNIGSNDEFGINNKKEKNNKIIAAVVILLVLAGVLFLGYKKYFTPKNMFKNSLNKGYKEVENFINDIEKVSKKGTGNKETVTASQNMNINLSVNKSMVSDRNAQALIDELNKISFNTKVGIDEKNSEMLINFNSLYNNKELVGIGAYLKDKKAYIELKNIYDKYIEVPVDEMTSTMKSTTATPTIDTDDLKYVMKKGINAFADSLDNKEFKTSSEKIKIDGKTVKATKVTYALSEKDATAISKRVVEKLLKDEKFIKSFASISNQEKDDVKEMLEDSLSDVKEELNSDLDTKDTIYISAYVTGIAKTPVGFEFRVKDEDNNAAIAYYKKNDKKEIVLKNEDEVVLTAKITDKKTVVEASSKGQSLTLTIDKKVSGKTTEYVYNLDVAGMVSSEGSLKETIKSEDKKGNMEAEDVFTLNVKAAGTEMAKLTIKGDSKVEVGNKLSMPSFTKTVNIEDLDDTDQYQIISNISKNQTLANFIQKINRITNRVDY